MKTASFCLAATLAAVTLSAPVLAQEAPFKLPKECSQSSAMGGMDHTAGHGGMHDQNGSMASGMMGMGDMQLDNMPEHVQENMRRMMLSMPAMHAGMMNEDADVAFACGMIAHHQGAIDMAQVLLEHGKDPTMRSLAEDIIKAQVAEIDRMSTWLAESAKQ